MDKLDLKNSSMMVSATDPDELKEWKVGKQYMVKMMLKMKSMQHDKEGGKAQMDIMKIMPEKVMEKAMEKMKKEH